MSESGLTKQERLRRDKDIQLLFTGGASGFVYPFRYHYIVSAVREDEGGRDTGIGPAVGEDSSAPAVRVLFTVPKKIFRRANKRNLFKRRMREAYRLNKSLLAATARQRGVRVDIALVYAVKEESNYKTVENGIRKILKTIGEGL